MVSGGVMSGDLGFPGGSDGKESGWNAGDLSSIPGLGRSLKTEFAQIVRQEMVMATEDGEGYCKSSINRIWCNWTWLEREDKKDNIQAHILK